MHRYLPFLLIVGLLIVFRVVGSAFPETLPNFQPLAALFFCGALLAPGWRGFAIPAGIWALTFPLGFGHGSGVSLFLTTLLALTCVFFLGRALSRRGVPALLLGTLGGALVFHLITCGAAWGFDPRYAKSLAGFWQAVWLGAPGDVLPSWVFLRNFAAANLIFTGVFLLSRVRLPRLPAPIESPVATPAPIAVKSR